VVSWPFRTRRAFSDVSGEMAEAEGWWDTGGGGGWRGGKQAAYRRAAARAAVNKPPSGSWKY